MPNTREKLIEVIRNFNSKIVPYYAEEIADKLIANGVTIANQVASSSKYLASSEWIPVAERLPEEYKTVLVYNPNVDHGQTVMEAVRIDNTWKTEFDFEACENNEITHWMPLPEPPKGE